jgi:hypothetical protein
MMTVPLRAALPSQLRNSLAAVRSWLLLTLLVLFGGIASAQSLSPGGPINFGPNNLGTTSDTTLTFTAPPGGSNIKSVIVVTNGVIGQDFKLVSDPGCIGPLPYLAKCVITISFSPTQIGLRLGALSIIDSTNKVVNQVYLSGVGVGPQFVFAPATAITTATSSTLTPASFRAGASVQDANGNLFFTDVLNNRILERSSTNVFSVVTSTLAVTATSGLTIDGLGTLYVSSNNYVYSFMPGGTPTIVPTPGVTLSTPTGLAMDSAGDLYIADSTNNKVYQIPLGTNTAATLALTGPGAALLGPTGLAVDFNNILYIADSGHNRIVETPLNTLVTTIVSLTSLTLNNPTGVSVDGAGTLYIANTGGADIIEATVTGAQFILVDPAMSLSTPSNIVVEANGDLILSDTTRGLIDVPRSSPAVNFPTPTVVGTLDATDDPEDLTVQSSGNITTDLTSSSTDTNPSISTVAFQLGNAPTGPCPVLSAGAPVTPADAFSPGEVCVYAIDFKPTVVGLNSANLILATSAAAGALTTSTTVPLTGTGLSTINSFRLVASPTSINKGGSVQLVLTALNADGTTVATDYVGTVTFTTSDSTGLYLGGTSPNTATTTYTFTAANNGVLTIPASSGLQLNQYGVFTASVTDGKYSATSNNVYVVEPSTLTLTSSINPSLINQTTVFTLSVATTGNITPGGTVTFYSNGVVIGTVALSPTGNPSVSSASVSDSFAAVGNYAITATYVSNTNTQGGTAQLTQVVGLPTSVTLTSSVNPSLVNQSTTLTATISAVATPTGTVTFYNGSTALGTVPVNGTTATLPVSFATSGTYPLTAVYTTTSPNPDVTSATSAVLNQVVQNIASLTLSSSVNPSQIGQATILTANLTALGTPTGTVRFYDGATQIGIANLTGSTASISVSFATPGTHTLKAVYSGDTLTSTATSAPLAQVVINSSGITLSSSVNPSLVGQSTTLTANLTALGTPTGTVRFYDGATLIATANLTGATASVSVSFATAGTHPLTAVYSGDTNTQTATSATLSQVVLNIASITLTSSVNPSQPNQSTTLTANLTALGTPTGTVKFYDGTTLIGTVNVVGGMASLPISFTTPGTHSLKAVYSGDSLTSAGTSATLAQIVLNPSTITLTTSVNPVNVNANTTLTSTITSTGTPTGTVTFYAGAKRLGSATVNGGVAVLVVSFPTEGIYSLTAVYSGDGNNQTATSAPISQTVLNLVTVALASSNNPVLLDNPTILTAIIASPGTSPTGTVSFYDGATPLGVAPLVNGAASISATFVYAGTHTLTALYSGDSITAPQSSPALTQTVADFSFALASGSSSSNSTLAGGTASYSLALTPLITSTLPSAVTITLTGLPSTDTYVLSPATIAAGSGATPVGLSITAAQIVAAIRAQEPPPHHSPARYAPVALGLLALPLAWFRRRKRFGSLFASICLLLAITGGLTGCISTPSTGYYGQTPQTYNVTVTATSGNLARATYLTLTIQ